MNLTPKSEFNNKNIIYKKKIQKKNKIKDSSSFNKNIIPTTSNNNIFKIISLTNSRRNRNYIYTSENDFLRKNIFNKY